MPGSWRGHHADPDLAPRRHGARRGRRLGQAPRGSRHPQPRRTLQPAIRYAEDGYPVQPRVALDWSRSVERVAGDPASAATYLIDGRPRPSARSCATRSSAPPCGASRNPPARLLRGAGGRGHGGAAARIGGCTRSTTSPRIPEIVTPVTTRYRGYDVYECPPSGQGLAVLMMLNVLSHYDIAALSELDRVHLFAEACKQAYHHRDALFADPVLNGCRSSTCCPRRGGRAPTAPSTWPRPGAVIWPELLHKDTVCLSVVDRDGNALS